MHITGQIVSLDSGVAKAKIFASYGGLVPSKRYVLVCASIEDSDQPAYPHNLISVCSMDSQGPFLLKNA